jgi:hypothetical protein
MQGEREKNAEKCVFLVILQKTRTKVGVNKGKSGKRDSNPRPSAWEADALPTELFPHGREE